MSSTTKFEKEFYPSFRVGKDSFFVCFLAILFSGLHRGPALSLSLHGTRRCPVFICRCFSLHHTSQCTSMEAAGNNAMGDRGFFACIFSHPPVPLPELVSITLRKPWVVVMKTVKRAREWYNGQQGIRHIHPLHPFIPLSELMSITV